MPRSNRNGFINCVSKKFLQSQTQKPLKSLKASIVNTYTTKEILLHLHFINTETCPLSYQNQSALDITLTYECKKIKVKV